MILIGAAYQNNLVNLLGFFMLAMFFTTMLSTHENVRGIEIVRVENVHGFAGEEMAVSILVRNPTGTPKSNCDFNINGFQKLAQYDARITIGPGQDARLLASFKAPERGVHELSTFVLSTTAPFGLFRAWHYQPFEAKATVYPKRHGDREWTLTATGSDGQLERGVGAEDYREHRSYTNSDNLRRVDWRIYARNRLVLVKEFDEPSGHELKFDYSALGDLQPEARLEQLTQWIDRAQKSGHSFTLTLPGRNIGPQNGLAFAHRAWSELAHFKIPDTNAEAR